MHGWRVDSDLPWVLCVTGSARETQTAAYAVQLAYKAAPLYRTLVLNNMIASR